MSTHVTSLPKSENPAPVTSPTYPVPMTASFITSSVPRGPGAVTGHAASYGSGRPEPRSHSQYRATPSSGGVVGA